jgi:VanZ family protein
MRTALPQLLRHHRLWQLALAAYWLMLFVGTHIPIERMPMPARTADKWAHVVVFALLSALFAATWELSAGRLNVAHLLRVWFVVALYGAFEEATQPLVNRYASIYDWLADVVGAGIGLVLFVVVRYALLRCCHSEGGSATEESNLLA